MENTLGLQIEITKELNEMLMRTCDIRFYKKLQQPQFSENGEVYSHKCQAFAHDGSGGEFVLLEDGSIGLISSEGSVGRVADRLDDLLTFLVNGVNIFDFNYINLYKNKELLRTFCMAYLKKCVTNMPKTEAIGTKYTGPWQKNYPYRLLRKTCRN